MAKKQLTNDEIRALRFEDLYATEKAKKRFLATLDWINLEKASKIGSASVRTGKNPTKENLIDGIIKYDLKNNDLICKTIFKNIDIYSQPASHQGMKEQIADLQRSEQKQSEVK